MSEIQNENLDKIVGVLRQEWQSVIGSIENDAVRAEFESGFDLFDLAKTYRDAVKSHQNDFGVEESVAEAMALADVVKEVRMTANAIKKIYTPGVMFI